MENISFLIDYHIWAHNKVLQQLQTITAEEWDAELGGSFPSLHKLCEHIITADYRWLQRWKGDAFAAIPETFVFTGYTQVAATWLPILDEMQTVSKHSFEMDATQPVNLITTKGAKYTLPFWQTVYQVVNHGTYHRGQITNMLRMLNKQPANTDILLFFVEKNGH